MVEDQNLPTDISLEVVSKNGFNNSLVFMRPLSQKLASMKSKAPYRFS